MSPTSENDAVRQAADNGEGKLKWARTQLVVQMQHELVAIEHLAQRISFLAAAERRLGEVVPARVYDEDRLRVIRLALNSTFEAIEKVEYIALQVDKAEGRPPRNTERKPNEACEATMDGLDSYASDLSFQANAEAYMLGLVPSRRRPDGEAVAFMKFLVISMMNALVTMGKGRRF